jgi:antitoxin PrlF
MKVDAKITSKGQITVPKQVRASLGVGAGDRIRFIRDDHGIHVVPVADEDVFEQYRGMGNPGIPSGREAIIRHFRELRGHDDLG